MLHVAHLVVPLQLARLVSTEPMPILPVAVQRASPSCIQVVLITLRGAHVPGPGHSHATVTMHHDSERQGQPSSAPGCDGARCRGHRSGSSPGDARRHWPELPEPPTSELQMRQNTRVRLKRADADAGRWVSLNSSEGPSRTWSSSSADAAPSGVIKAYDSGDELLNLLGDIA